MAKKMKFSVNDVADVLKSGRKATEGADAPVLVRILVDATAPRDLVHAVRDALLPERVGAEVVVGLLGQVDVSSWMCDACVVVCGESRDLICDAVTQVARRGIPLALVAESAVAVPDLAVLGIPDDVVSSVVSSSGALAVSKLARWLVDATDKHLAFAANFPFCRGAAVDRLVRACALQNALVGAVDLIPGADMPVMTANQAKLALEVAAAYGRGLNASRAPELAGVLVAGLAYRSVTRRLLEFAPGVGGIVRGGMGYAGSMLTGKAVAALFDAQDRGVTPRSVAERVVATARDVADAAGDLVARVSSLAGRESASQGAMVASHGIGWGA